MTNAYHMWGQKHKSTINLLQAKLLSQKIEFSFPFTSLHINLLILYKFFSLFSLIKVFRLFSLSIAIQNMHDLSAFFPFIVSI